MFNLNFFDIKILQYISHWKQWWAWFLISRIIEFIEINKLISRYHQIIINHYFLISRNSGLTISFACHSPNTSKASPKRASSPTPDQVRSLLYCLRSKLAVLPVQLRHLPRCFPFYSVFYILELSLLWLLLLLWVLSRCRPTWFLCITLI